MDENLRPKNNCYMSSNYPHVASKGTFKTFDYIYNLSPDLIKDIADTCCEYIEQEGKFADSIVIVEFSKDHAEVFPYISTFDFNDVECLKRKFPTAYDIRVYNLKNFRELYFELLFDNDNET